MYIPVRWFPKNDGDNFWRMGPSKWTNSLIWLNTRTKKMWFMEPHHKPGCFWWKVEGGWRCWVPRDFHHCCPSQWHSPVTIVEVNQDQPPWYPQNMVHYIGGQNKLNKQYLIRPNKGIWKIFISSSKQLTVVVFLTQPLENWRWWIWDLTLGPCRPALLSGAFQGCHLQPT